MPRRHHAPRDAAVSERSRRLAKLQTRQSARSPKSVGEFRFDKNRHAVEDKRRNPKRKRGRAAQKLSSLIGLPTNGHGRSHNVCSKRKVARRSRSASFPQRLGDLALQPPWAFSPCPLCLCVSKQTAKVFSEDARRFLKHRGSPDKWKIT